MADETSPGAFEIVSSPPDAARDNVPRTPFWDHAPTVEGKDQDVYVQFNQRRVTDWERVSLGGIELPGVCRVASSGRSRKVDVAGSPGDDVEAVIDAGATAAEVSINVTLWTPAHLARWEKFMETARNWFSDAETALKAKEPPPGLDVIHPGLNLAGINSLYLRQVGIPAPGGVKGTYEVAIFAVEYRHRPKAKKQDLKPVDNSLDALDKKQAAKELQPKTPAQTEAKP